VAEYHLEAVSPLGGYAQTFDGLALRELEDAVITSLAIPLGGETEAGAIMNSAFGLSMPEIGTSMVTKDNTRLIRLGEDHLICLSASEDPDAANQISGRLNGAFYTTDQSDVWAAIEISGHSVRAVLERTCPIDLDPEIFRIGGSVRTAMEHMSAIIVRTDENTFLLLCASSSAESFLHMLETSISVVQ